MPTWGAVLRAVTLPDVGGDTIWVRLASPTTAVTHDYRDALAAVGQDYPIVAHPIVRTHRETGDKILFVNFTEHPWIVGLDRVESRELLSIVPTSIASPSSRSGSAGVPGRSRSGTTGPRCTTPSATTATSPACSSGS